MVIETLRNLLEIAAQRHGSRGLVVYPQNNVESSQKMGYSDLLGTALYNSRLLVGMKEFSPRHIVLIHLDDHLSNIIWFWALILANAIPVMSTPFSNIPEQREKHIHGLNELFGNPVWITRDGLLPLFENHQDLTIQTTEALSLLSMDTRAAVKDEDTKILKYPDVAMLMLTSGSTGNAKAVCLENKQILAAIQGKASVRSLHHDNPFLNWIGLDHVASLVEIHLQAMYLGMDQIHVHPSDVVTNPATFLTLLSRHRVTRSFAPNFFLARLKATLDSREGNEWRETIDLSYLRVLASGGEANNVDICEAVSRELATHGAPLDVIVTGFGMTETCAGAIFNLQCPKEDLLVGREFASLGHCMPGISMRITIPSEAGSFIPAGVNEIGDLELQGPVVFKEYFNNASATADAFTTDGWFKTGDRAIIDKSGNLNLAGRAKDIMNINGVNYVPQEVETILAEYDETLFARLVCFPFRSAGRPTEEICIIYIPNQSTDSFESLFDFKSLIIRLVMLHTSVSPYVLALKDETLLPKSTLGKVSRAKLRSAFENGTFSKEIDENNRIMQKYRNGKLELLPDDIERLLLVDFQEAFDFVPDVFGVETPIFDMGITSIDLIRLKKTIDARLRIEIPIVTLMQNPTVRSLAKALQGLMLTKKYDPVVVLRRDGPKTPLWLIHPGVGEVLVFLGLATHIDDRPVFALRARGFDGEPQFTDIQEALAVYYDAIKATQPHGPYAIAGYSYGSMLAFELTKMLESNPQDKVSFLGSFNLPPHIKDRMKQLNWNMCLLHLSYFLGLVTEHHANSISDSFRGLPRAEALADVIASGDSARMDELSLTPTALIRWANIAYGLQSMATDYEPIGMVARMDIFYATPLAAVAVSREYWLNNHLSKWKDFCLTNPSFHEVNGAHYTMIGAEHVYSFSKKLREVLKVRLV